jgi:hypothetical protein
MDISINKHTLTTGVYEVLVIHKLQVTVHRDSEVEDTNLAMQALTFGSVESFSITKKNPEPPAV